MYPSNYIFVVKMTITKNCFYMHSCFSCADNCFRFLCFLLVAVDTLMFRNINNIYGFSLLRPFCFVLVLQKKQFCLGNVSTFHFVQGAVSVTVRSSFFRTKYTSLGANLPPKSCSETVTWSKDIDITLGTVSLKRSEMNWLLNWYT